jgi:hypothetical protein
MWVYHCSSSLYIWSDIRHILTGYVNCLGSVWCEWYFLVPLVVSSSRWLDRRMYEGGLISLWLFKENIKLWDWKNVFTYSPELHTLMTSLF